MYRKVLILTDRSALSKQAVTGAIAFARNINATVIGVYVTPDPQADLHVGARLLWQR